jgi:hypothetical protein
MEPTPPLCRMMKIIDNDDNGNNTCLKKTAFYICEKTFQINGVRSGIFLKNIKIFILAPP